MKKIVSSNVFVRLFLLILVSFLSGEIFALSENPKESKSVFQVQNPDYKLSPHTGMTRQHWKDAALYVLKGAFGYIHSLDDPMKFPKQEGKSYPQKSAQIPTEKLEGLSRTLFVAAPLLKENPNLELNGIKVADYYRHQLCNLFRPSSPSYIKPQARNGGPNQNLVEFGAMAISMTAIPEVLWEPLSQSQKDSLANLMISYGDGKTVDSNWKFFNIFVLSFFKDHGYKVNEKLLVQYLEKSLAAYRGEGWYNDSPAYDYYSMWAFQMYGIYWAEYYGKKYYPEIADKFLHNFYDLKDNYPYLFSRDGKMIMWGRSISYRYAAATPFPFMGYENQPGVNWGWMRQIASSTMLQFLTHPEFMDKGVPTLGFYGPFEPAVQVYSCRGSVYWGGKIFLGLLIPENSPFWTAAENQGPWETDMKKDSVYNRFAPGSGTLITNYPNIGASEVRAWCHASVAGDWQLFRSTENYNRLSYSSAFPWQADGERGEVSMNYVIKNARNKWEALRLYDFKRFENGIYYRDVTLETNGGVKMQLADITLPNGILRVDKLTVNPDSLNEDMKTIQIRLGHYSLPQLSKAIHDASFRIGGHDAKSIDNGEYTLTMIPVKGFEAMEFVHSTGLHPVKSASAVIDAKDQLVVKRKNTKFYITLMLWSKSDKPLSNRELKVLKRVKVAKDEKSVELSFSDKTKKIVVF
ncbi:MAG: hypothetical protein RIS29_2005 [Bacteroidota bacterium]|jgi:hypothetical protein